MAVTMTPPRYRFRAGALDHIMRSRNLTTEAQLATALGCRIEDIPKLRAGALVTARMALRVAALQGDRDYISGYFDQAEDPQAA